MWKITASSCFHHYQLSPMHSVFLCSVREEWKKALIIHIFSHSRKELWNFELHSWEIKTVSVLCRGFSVKCAKWHCKISKLDYCCTTLQLSWLTVTSRHVFLFSFSFSLKRTSEATVKFVYLYNYILCTIWSLDTSITLTPSLLRQSEHDWTARGIYHHEPPQL